MKRFFLVKTKQNCNFSTNSKYAWIGFMSNSWNLCREMNGCILYRITPSSVVITRLVPIQCFLGNLFSANSFKILKKEISDLNQKWTSNSKTGWKISNVQLLIPICEVSYGVISKTWEINAFFSFVVDIIDLMFGIKLERIWRNAMIFNFLINIAKLVEFTQTIEVKIPRQLEFISKHFNSNIMWADTVSRFHKNVCFAFIVAYPENPMWENI